MKWSERHEPEKDARRVNCRFLFFPKCVDGQWRWWEYAYWTESYHPGEASFAEWISGYWEAKEWLSFPDWYDPKTGYPKPEYGRSGPERPRPSSPSRCMTCKFLRAGETRDYCDLNGKLSKTYCGLRIEKDEEPAPVKRRVPPSIRPTYRSDPPAPRVSPLPFVGMNCTSYHHPNVGDFGMDTGKLFAALRDSNDPNEVILWHMVQSLCTLTLN
jgi:hypothetical protein